MVRCWAAAPGVEKSATGACHVARELERLDEGRLGVMWTTGLLQSDSSDLDLDQKWIGKHLLPSRLDATSLHH